MRSSHSRSPSRRSIALEIRDVAFGGAGVGQHDGKIVFVPFTLDGEKIEAEIIEQRKNFDRGQLRKVILQSAQRVNPVCPYFGQCGGCDYQHIAYPHQLELKRRQVVQLLERIGGISDAEVSPTLASASPYAFRNRITVHGRQGRIGFFRQNSRDVVDIERCAIAVPAVNDALRELRATGLADGKHKTIRGAGVPRTFTQTNDLVARVLLDFVSRQTVGDVLLDAYCGSGFFGHALSEKFKKVVGIDWDEPAINAARDAARWNETYICGDVAGKIDSLLITEEPDTIILDPSAEGVDEGVAKALLIKPPGRLIYVSCDPATLARDLARLREAYHIGAVQPFDMFPQTAKIETVAVLSS